MGGDGKPGSPEHKIKRFLDCCGYLLLRENPEGTLTDYEEMMHGSREISVSSCPSWIGDKVDGGGCTLTAGQADEQARFECLLDKLDQRVEKYKRREKKRRVRAGTRFDRLEAIRKAHPGCSLTGCRVDVNGAFEYDGKRYRVDSTRGKYAPRDTCYGEQYDMDRIVVIALPGGGKLFADQDGWPVDAEMITELER